MEYKLEKILDKYTILYKSYIASAYIRLQNLKISWHVKREFCVCLYLRSCSLTGFPQGWVSDHSTVHISLCCYTHAKSLLHADIAISIYMYCLQFLSYCIFAGGYIPGPIMFSKAAVTCLLFTFLSPCSHRYFINYFLYLLTVPYTVILSAPILFGF